jgi:hypothetical protein
MSSPMNGTQETGSGESLTDGRDKPVTPVIRNELYAFFFKDDM